jgi:hypothetical protein
MSSRFHVRKRSGIWSYIPFNSGATSSRTRNRRTSSVSLPQSNLRYTEAATTSSSDAPSSSNLAATSYPGDYYKSHRSYPRPPTTTYSGASSGHDDTWMTGRKRFRLFRVAAVLGLIVFAIYFLTPNSERQKVEQYVQGIVSQLNS